jgi:DNA polymerase-3 subunit delta'
MDFIGQESIIEGFRDRIVHNTMSHAYALTGPAGMGKRTLASYITKMLLCQGPALKAPCCQCRSCKSFDAGSNPNVTFIRNETQKILIKQIRDMIDDISIRPASGLKVYIIEEAERMTPDAQNCLLKTLEEPPPYAVILLTTAYFESLLSTVRSRVVNTRMKAYTFEELARIAKYKELDISGKEYLLNWSQGVPGNVIQLLGDRQFDENRKMVMKFVFNDGEFPDLELNKYLSGNKETFGECMDILESVYRDTLLIMCGEDEGLINSDKKANIVEYAKHHETLELTVKIEKINEIRNDLKRNMNYQLAVDMVTLVD